MGDCDFFIAPARLNSFVSFICKVKFVHGVSQLTLNICLWVKGQRIFCICHPDVPVETEISTDHNFCIFCSYVLIFSVLANVC